MKRFIKVLLGLVVGLMLLLVLAAVVLPMIYDKEDLKKTIAKQVHTRTGRDLRIDGALDFTVFPWVAVEVGDLTLSNAEGFGDQPFARIGRARVGVALLPLFKKQLVADEVTLDGLELSLAVNKNGKNNWDDLASSDETGTDPVASGEAGLFSNQHIAGLNIRDSEIEYNDQQAGSHYRVQNFSMQTGALGDAKPVQVEMGMLLQDVIGNSSNDVTLAATTEMDFAQETYVFHDFELSVRPRTPSGEASDSDAIVIHAPSIEANLAQQTLMINSFDASIGAFNASGGLAARKILDDPVFDGSLSLADFSPRDLMQSLAMEVPLTTDPDVLKQARMEAAFEGSGSNLTVNNITLNLDQSVFAGELSINNFAKPAIQFDFDVDTINLDRYMEPASEDAETDVTMPKEELKDVNLQGTLRVGSLQLAGLDLSNAVLGLMVRNGKLRINPLTAGFYDGKYDGNINLDSSGATPVVSIDEKLDSITFQRMMADLTDSQNLSGTGKAHVRLTGMGHSSNEVMSTLKGDLALTLDEGALEGINIWYEIRRAYSLYKGLDAPQPEAKRTVFSRMQFEATVEDGVLTTRQLVGDLPFLSLRGSGNVDLGQSLVDLKLTATVRKAPELAQDEAGTELEGKQLPFVISGALDDPKISVDWGKLAQGEATDMLLDKLGLGSKSGSGEQTSDDNEEAGSSKDKKKDRAKDMLFDLLKGKNKDKDEKDGD